MAEKFDRRPQVRRPTCAVAARAPEGRRLFDRPLRLEHLESRRLLATVTAPHDNSVADAELTLREAIAATADGGTVDFAPSLFAGGPVTIALTNFNHAGEIAINKNLTIQGPGASLLTIKAFDPDMDGANNGNGSRIFNIDDGTAVLRQVNIRDVTLTGGDVAGHGGAISLVENLNLLRAVLTGNHATLTGGALSHFQSTIVIADSVISDNVAAEGGGVFHNQGHLTLARSTLSGNMAVDGGALVTNGDASINASTFENNRATYGGAISHNPAFLNIADSTFVGNEANQGGAILTETALNVNQTTIVNSTFSANEGFLGAAIFNGVGATEIRHSTITLSRLDRAVVSRSANSRVTFYSSIVAGNFDPTCDSSTERSTRSFPLATTSSMADTVARRLFFQWPQMTYSRSTPPS
jgi:hypothetical protein